MEMKLSEHNRRQGHYTLLSVKRIRTMEKCTTAKAERRNRCPKWRRWDAMRLSDLKELGLWQAYHTPGERPWLQDSISRHDGLMDLPMSYLWVRSGLNYRMTYSNGSGCITIPLRSVTRILSMNKKNDLLTHPLPYHPSQCIWLPGSPQTIELSALANNSRGAF